MSGENKEKPSVPGRPVPAHPQPTWPTMDFNAWQWQQMQWQHMAAMAYSNMGMPYLPHGMVPPQASAVPAASTSTSSAISSTNPSPRSKDCDSVKLVKPKDPQVRGINSPAGIQSPKPNSPGFLLGASKGGGGFRAFSPYTARSDTPITVPSISGLVSTDPISSAGIDLSKNSSRKSAAKAVTVSESSSTEKKEDKPVGIVNARQRSATDSKSRPGQTRTTDVTITSSAIDSSTTTTTLTTTVGQVATPSTTAPSIASATQQPTPVSTVGGQWPPFAPPIPYMANPYHHFTMAQPTMYMVPHRPMFPGQPGVPGPPGYLPVPHQQVLLPEQLTVKTQQQVTAHASTSPNKPASAEPSPKSPLDKFREKCNERTQKSKDVNSKPPSPTNSEAKSVSSESTEKTGEGSEKPQHTSVIIANAQAMTSSSEQHPERKAKKREKKERHMRPGKVRKTMSTGSIMSTDVASVPTPPSQTSPITPFKSLIAPAKFNPEPTNKPVDSAPTSSPFAKPNTPKPNKRPASTDRLRSRQQHRSSSKDSADGIESKPGDALPPVNFSKTATATSSADTVTSPDRELPAVPATTASPESKPSPTKQPAGRSAVKVGSTGRSRTAARLSALKTTVVRKSTREKPVVAVADAFTFNPDKEDSASTTPALDKSSRSKVELEESEVKECVTESKQTAVLPKQVKGRKQQKRKSTESADASSRKRMTVKTEAVSAPVQPPVPIDVENKAFLWAEDAFDPIIVKHNSVAYDVWQEDDLKDLEAKLKARLKAINKQIQSHQKCLDGDTCALTLHRSLSNSESQNKSGPSSPDKAKSCFSVRSDSHPSLKMKAAAKAKSRASQSEETSGAVIQPPPPLSKPAKGASHKSKRPVMEPLAPIIIPDHQLVCRQLKQAELLSSDTLILICIKGLFYESRIKPIEPPDLYGIFIDGERQSKPHICTEEELLINTFTNLTPMYISQLQEGSRVCAYWSEVIGCLYPGTVTALCPSTVNPSKHLIDIEFDDGDSGKFPLHQIRLLPPDHPHVEYDTSTVIASGRRRGKIPETPPIMTTPPGNRSRLSQSASSPKNSATSGKGKKGARGRPPTVQAAEAEVFDQSTDDELTVSVAADTKISHWEWYGKTTKKQARGRGFKVFYDAITREGGDVINVGDCAVFKSIGSNTLPYIGEIQSMWEGAAGKMLVNVKWFYHPEELQEVKVSLPKHKGALFHSEHIDQNDVQTIRHKCEVVHYNEYLKRKLHLRSGEDRRRFSAFYLAGSYDAVNSKILSVYV